MPIYRVRCFDGHKWDEGEGGVQAQNEKEAAERVCGVPLVTSGTPVRLRAQVSASDKPGAKSLFYEQAEPAASEFFPS